MPMVRLIALAIGGLVGIGSVQTGAQVSGVNAGVLEHTIRKHFGAEAAARAVHQGTSALDRTQAALRLGTLDSPEAIAMLAAEVNENSALATDSRSLHEAVRLLAPHAREEPVRQALAYVVANPRTDGVLTELARGVAAMALARTRDPEAVVFLASALRAGEGPGFAAANALRAYPPRSTSLLWGTDNLATPAIVALLGDLGDRAAIKVLRPLLQSDRSDLATTAALALGRLHDQQSETTIRSWLSFSDEGKRMVGTVALLAMGRLRLGELDQGVLGATDPTSWIDELGTTPAAMRASTAVQLWPRLSDPSRRRLAHMVPEQERESWGADLCRIVSAESPEKTASAFAVLLTIREAWKCVPALAKATDGPRRRSAVRAWVLRERSDPSRALLDELASLLRSRDDDDAFLGAWGHTIVGRAPPIGERAAHILGTASGLVGASRAPGIEGRHLWTQTAKHLGTRDQARVAAILLAWDPWGASVGEHSWRQWIQGDDPLLGRLAAQTAESIGILTGATSLEDHPVGSTVESWILAAGVNRKLAIGPLTRTLISHPHPEQRAQAAGALIRLGVARDELEFCRTFDPDPGVRKHCSEGTTLERKLYWFHVPDSRSGWLEDAAGRSFPFVTDADGSAVVWAPEGATAHFVTESQAKTQLPGSP